MRKMLSEEVSASLEFLRDAVTAYHMSEAEARECDQITQDILHDLELNPHDAKSRARVGRELTQTRRRRRAAKDRAATLAPLVEWMDGNKPAVKALERALGAMRRQEEAQKNRVYTPRVRRPDEKRGE